MNTKESDMKGRREERNVLDELLDHPEDDELDVELIKGFKKPRGIKIKLLPAAPPKADQHGSRFKGNGSNGNGNGKQQQTTVAAVRAESVGSEYSTHSGSCSCEDHSSRSASRSPSPPPPRRHSPPVAGSSSHQSFTRSPSLKIKIHSNSDSRTVKNLNSPPPDLGQSAKSTKRRHKDEGSDVRSKKRKKSAKSRDYNSLLKYFFKDSCYFVMKSNNEENVLISKRESVWATPNSNEIKLNSAFNEFRNVILIFSVKESGKFQGFARLSSLANYDSEPVNWSLPPGVKKCPFGGLFYVDWINRSELSFNNTTHLFNSFNDGKPVKIGRDGQEIDPQVGEELCRLFPPDNDVDLIPLLKRMKNQTQNRPKKRHVRRPFMEPDSARSGAPTSQDYRVRSHSSSEAYSVRKRTSSNSDAHLTRHYSSRNIRDDRDYSSSDRNRYSTRRHEPTNGHYRLQQGNSYDLHYDPYRRMPSRHESSSHSRPERRTRDDRRYY